MNIYIADKEKENLTLYESIIKEVFPKANTRYFTNNKNIYEESTKIKPDIVIIDADDNNSMIIAKKLEEINDRVNLIIVEGITKRISEANDLFVSGYLKKPLTKDNVNKQLCNLRYPV